VFDGNPVVACNGAISLCFAACEGSRRCFLLCICLHSTRVIRLHGLLTRLGLIMKHRIAGLASLSRASTSTCSPSLYTSSLARRLPRFAQHNATNSHPLQLRSFATTSRLGLAAPKKTNDYDPNARPAAELNNNITQEEKDHFAKKLAEDKGKQIRTPWHREGSDVAPVARQRSAGAMTKGACYQPQNQRPLTNKQCRKVAHNTIAHAQDRPSPHDARQQHRPQRH